jgi:hypothetical protein
MNEGWLHLPAFLLYLVVGFMTEFVEPGLCDGEGEDEFDEVGFVEHGEW